jgi:hypothetical protein
MLWSVINWGQAISQLMFLMMIMLMMTMAIDGDEEDVEDDNMKY